MDHNQLELELLVLLCRAAALLVLLTPGQSLALVALLGRVLRNHVRQIFLGQRLLLLTQRGLRSRLHRVRVHQIHFLRIQVQLNAGATRVQGAQGFFATRCWKQRKEKKV